MGNASNFEIKKGVLTKYIGKETEVVIPEGIAAIGKKAFAENKKLTKVILPDSVNSIEKEAFASCKKLNDVIMGNGIVSIGARAFAHCVSLEKLILPERLETIEEDAFCCCECLKSVVFPAGLKAIGDSAFWNCDALEKAEVPESVTTIGARAFEGCRKLADENGLIIVHNIVFGGTGKIAEIPQGVREISARAFSYNRILTSVTIPESVTVIGEGAFEKCNRLTNVRILGKNISIGRYAFSGCTGLLDQNDLIVVNGILYDYAGKGGEVVIPEGVTTLEENAFLNCPVITKVTLPESLQKIGYMAFSGCTGLADENGMVIVGNRLYNYYGTETDLTIPDHVTYIEDYAFRNFQDLKCVRIPASVQVLSQYAFVGDIGGLKVYCSGKQFDALYKSVKESIVLDWLGGNESYAPDQLAAMQKVAGKMMDKLFETIQNDDGTALAKLLGCAKVKPEKIEKYISKCNDGLHPAMLSVLLDYENRNYPKTEEKHTDNLDLVFPEMTEQEWKKIYRWEEDNGAITLLKYKGVDQRVELPWEIDGIPVTKIGKNAFKGNTNLEEIVLAPNIVEIGESAFEGCEKLANIVWNEKLVTIGKRAFYNCYQLNVIKLPADVIEVGVNAFGSKFEFDGNTLSIITRMHLSEVHLPEKVKVFKQFLGEFSDYSVDVHFLGKKTKITAKDFFGAEVRLHVPAGSKTEEYAKKANVPFVAE